MKKLLVYYSYEGNTARLAAEIDRHCPMENVVRLRPVFEKRLSGIRKYFWGGKQIFFAEKPFLEPLNIDWDDYDLLVIGSPVWAGGFAPALRTLFSSNRIKGKQLALFVTHLGGGRGAINRMAAALPGNELIARLDVKNVAALSDDQLTRVVKDWTPQLNHGLSF